ncbi:hypothetical protein J6590_012376 [Homalodisca vitripennis]|nr:hypothetical protein J6590_012376 [Homalodisca vitripennis]
MVEKDMKKLTANLKQFLIRGLKQGGIVPELVQGKVGQVIAPTSNLPSERLLNILVEVKPLSGECDQLVHVLSQPLQFVYDAQTINKLIDVFTVETNTVITQLNAAAYTKLVEIKEKSALGLQHALQQRLRMDLNIDLMGFYGILPHGGFYTGCLNAGLQLFLESRLARDLAANFYIFSTHFRFVAEVLPQTMTLYLKWDSISAWYAVFTVSLLLTRFITEVAVFSVLQRLSICGFQVSVASKVRPRSLVSSSLIMSGSTGTCPSLPAELICFVLDGFAASVNQSLVGVNLGRMLINCKPRPPDELDIQTMVKRGSNESDIMKEMMDRSYDRFVVELREAQACLKFINSILVF